MFFFIVDFLLSKGEKEKLEFLIFEEKLEEVIVLKVKV